MRLEEARRVARAALAGQLIAIDAAFMDALVEECALELADGREQRPSQSAAYRIPMASPRSTAPQSGDASKPSWWLE